MKIRWTAILPAALARSTDTKADRHGPGSTVLQWAATFTPGTTNGLTIGPDSFCDATPGTRLLPYPALARREITPAG